ncbi:MAG: Gfo/Idh/MocA family protein [Nakamurella sp.]
MTATAEPLKIGIASLAHVHAAGYVAQLTGRDDIDLRIADPDGIGSPEHGRGPQFAAAQGISYVETYAELFDWCDAAIICSETARHRDLVVHAASAGADILCEKPIATRLDDAAAMLTACRGAGVRLMIAYPVRFHPSFRALRDAVRSGAVGSVVSASGTNNGKSPFTDRRWFVDRELAGGGALMDHTVHLADLLDDLLGVPPVEVFAQTNTVMHADDVDIDTGGLVFVTYADGTVATIDCSWTVPKSLPTWGGLDLEVETERGRFRFDGFGQRIEVYGDTDVQWIGCDPDLDALMLAEFLDAVRHSRQPQPDGDVGYRTLRLALAAYESAATGAPVAIPVLDPA